MEELDPKEWEYRFVREFSGDEATARELLMRPDYDVVHYSDCLCTPSGSQVLGLVRARKESDNRYRVLYVVRYPGGGIHLGEGLAMFGDEPAKEANRYGGAREFTKYPGL